MDKGVHSLFTNYLNSSRQISYGRLFAFLSFVNRNACTWNNECHDCTCLHQMGNTR